MSGPAVSTLEKEVFGKALREESMRDAFEVSCLFLLEERDSWAADAVMRRHGFDGYGKRTYAAMAKEIGRGAYIARQRVLRGYRILRHPFLRKLLQKFLQES